MWDADGPAKMIVNDLIDEVILGVAFEVHRSVKLGLDKLAEGINVDPEVTFGSNGLPSTSNGGSDSDHKGIEVFGAIPSKKQMECLCPNCNRTLGAARFAPHLEKCVGMGRNSSRLASRRIATNAAAAQASTSASTITTHSDDDDEWTLNSDRKRKRNTTREKSSRRNKKGRSNGDGGSVGSGSLPASPAGTPPETHNNRSNVICGVVSEHTGRTCTRSIKCPKHAHLRKPASSGGAEEGEPVDVDSVEDDTGRSWVDHPTAPSPAESSSSSVTSQKQHRGSATSKGKKRNHTKGKMTLTSPFLY